LDLELDLVTLPTGQDPCDILLGGGSEAFLAEIETGRNWFEQSLTRLATLRGAELSRAVDDLLALVQRIQSPVHRNSLWEQLAQQLGISKADLKDQWRKSAEGKHQERRAASTFSPREVAPETPAEPLQEPALKRRIDPQVARAFGEIIGAVLLDSSLVPLAKPLAKFCQEPDLKQILELVLEMYEDEHQAIDVTSVLSGLGDCPARVRVTSLAVHAESASSPKDLMDGALGYLNKRRGARQRLNLEGQARTLEQQLSQARGEDARAIKTELEETLGALRLLLQAEHPPSEPEGSRHSHKAD
jgi:DNA primase